MSVFRTRIRAVRFKNGGEVRLLPCGLQKSHDECLTTLKARVNEYAETFAGTMAGFILVVWDHKNASCATPFTSAASLMGVSQLPTFVAERVRRRLNEIDSEAIVDKALGLPPEVS